MKRVILTLMFMSTIMMASDGADLYNKCSSCHGVMGDKKALGKSKIINEMSQDDLITAMKGYQDGSYGGSMKALMKGQVAKLDEAQIKSLAEHISSLK